jgi:hypothetical protein
VAAKMAVIAERLGAYGEGRAKAAPSESGASGDLHLPGPVSLGCAGTGEASDSLDYVEEVLTHAGDRTKQLADVHGAF